MFVCYDGLFNFCSFGVSKIDKIFSVGLYLKRRGRGLAITFQHPSPASSHERLLYPQLPLLNRHLKTIPMTRSYILRGSKGTPGCLYRHPGVVTVFILGVLAVGYPRMLLSKSPDLWKF